MTIQIKKKHIGSYQNNKYVKNKNLTGHSLRDTKTKSIITKNPPLSVTPEKRLQSCRPWPCWPWLLLQHLIGPRPKPSGWIPSCKWSQCRDSHVPTPGTWGFHNDEDKTLKCWPPSYAAIGLEFISVTADVMTLTQQCGIMSLFFTTTQLEICETCHCGWDSPFEAVQTKGKQRCPSTTGCRCKARKQLPRGQQLSSPIIPEHLRPRGQPPSERSESVCVL